MIDKMSQTDRGWAWIIVAGVTIINVSFLSISPPLLFSFFEITISSGDINILSTNFFHVYNYISKHVYLYFYFIDNVSKEWKYLKLVHLSFIREKN